MSELSKVRMRTPNCSAFPIKWTNKLTNRIGDLRSLGWLEMMPNDRLRLSYGQITRLLPSKSPALVNFKGTIDAVFVPFRILGKEFEKFFNAGTDPDERPSLLYIPLRSWFDTLIFDIGLFSPSLADFLGYPVFPNVRDFVRNAASTMHDDNDDNALDLTQDITSYDLQRRVLDASYFDKDGRSVALTFPAGGYQVKNDFLAYNFHLFSFYYLSFIEDGNPWPFIDNVSLELFYTIPSGGSVAPYRSYLAKHGISWSSDISSSDALTIVCNHLNIPFTDVVKAYFSYIARCFALVTWRYSGMSDYVPFSDAMLLPGVVDTQADVWLSDPSRRLSLMPIIAFWKMYFDWYQNSILEDSSNLTEDWTYFLNELLRNNESLDGVDLPESLASFFDVSSFDGRFDVLFAIPKRLWSVDRFTGAYNDLQNGTAVRVPAEGTIRDLKASNKLFDFLQRSYYGGTRPQDSNLKIYGARSSNKLLDRTEVLCRKTFDINIQQVTNVAGSASFDLGSLAGNGFGNSGSFLFDYTCEEAGLIMLNISVTIPPSYMQAVDRCLLHTDYYDFLIPDFDGIGEQELNPIEVYCDKGMKMQPVSAYNRRYYEYIDKLSEVHGDFKDDLRYWHDARFFKDYPELSREFIHIHPEVDGLNRIFTTWNNEQILHYFAFSGVVVRPMSKFVKFGL